MKSGTIAATISHGKLLQFPHPGGAGQRAVSWDGLLFQTGNGAGDAVLDYTCGNDGWTDEHSVFTESTDSPNHFIGLASRRHTLAQVQNCRLSEAPAILEVGCSTGAVLADLQESFPHATIIGSDVSHHSLQQLAKDRPGFPLLRFDLTECPLIDNSLDVVIALNVLEHIEDDYQAAREIFRILKPNGKVVIEVPAGPELYDDYDRFLHHYRRYSMGRICKAMTAAGFVVEYKSHLACFIYPGFWLVKQLGKLLKKDRAAVDVNAVTRNIDSTSGNPLLKLVTDVELYLGKVLTYPFGIRCLLTCRKPG